MRALLTAVLLLAAAPLTAQAPPPDLTGRWEGLLRIPGEPTAFAVTFERSGDGWSARLDAPSRRVEQRPFQAVAVRGDSVVLEIPRAFLLRGLLAGGGGGLSGDAVIQGGHAPFALARAGTPRAGALAAELAASPKPKPAAHPDSARIVTEDIPRFWAAFDASTPETRAEVLQREYLDRASPGLEDFVFRRIHTARELAETVDQFPRYYRSTRESMARVAELEPQIRAAFRRMEALHPDAVYPDVYFMVGRLTTGGTTSPRGLLVGTELYSRTPQMPEDEFEPWMVRLFSPREKIPALVAHELIHYQQDVGGERNLLRQALVEGIADYLGEMITGRHINSSQHEYADAREAELWCAFREKMRGDDYSGWFYNARTSGERPADLGYWVGYKIAQAYAARVPDERQRVRELLHVECPEAFLAASGYAERFRCGGPGT